CEVAPKYRSHSVDSQVVGTDIIDVRCQWCLRTWRPDWFSAPTDRHSQPHIRTSLHTGRVIQTLPELFEQCQADITIRDAEARIHRHQEKIVRVEAEIEVFNQRKRTARKPGAGE